MMESLLYACKIHTRMFTASVVVCTVAQPDYNKNYSVRRNLYDGFTLGLLVGLTWPFTIPLIAHRYIKDIVDSDPIKNQIKTEIGYPREDWTKDWRIKVEQLIKKKDDEDNE